MLYRRRSDAEIRIKELKSDFSLGAFNHNEFFVSEATLHFVMMAYNLMGLFRQAVLGETKQSTVKTLRYKVLAIGAYITRDGRKRTLNLALAPKYREWFCGLWDVGEGLMLLHSVPG
ncbi:MAG TPA: transposase [Bacteroidota bacterium]|nr:transposase [Bacteroidota bacterium]